MSTLFDALSRAGGDAAAIMKRVMGAGGDSTAVTTSRLGRESSESAGPADIRTVPLRRTIPVLEFGPNQRKASEQYRIIRTKVVQHPKRPKVIVVSSGAIGDGKTFNAINLAGILSVKIDSRVLLVDADLRRSSVARAMGIEPGLGLAEVLRGQSTLRKGLVRIEEYPNLYVLPAGEPQDKPAELLDSAAWPTMLDIFRKRFSYVIVDAPPVAAVADYDLIQAPCDSVILIARQDHTNRAALAKAMQMVAKEKRLGVILNSVDTWWVAKASGQYYDDYDEYYPAAK